MKLRLHATADAELQAAARWYEDRVVGLGERFLTEIVDSLTLIERHPKRFSKAKYRTRREIRRLLLEHFPYSIVYEVREEEYVVVAIAHAHRRPNYWRDRLT